MNKKKYINYKSIIILGMIIIFLIIFVLFGINKIKNKKYDYNQRTSIEDNFVFLGDSITAYYPTNELYNDLPVINSGVASYTTTDILNNLDEMVMVYNPTKVFILIGTNDIKYNKTSDEIVENIKEIVTRILAEQPNTKIYIESIYPINNTDDEKINHIKVDIRTNEMIQEINKKIEKYCLKNNYTYIDMYSELIDKDGNLDIRYTTEGLHISNLGYLKITKVLYKYLIEG